MARQGTREAITTPPAEPELLVRIRLTFDSDVPHQVGQIVDASRWPIDNRVLLERHGYIERVTEDPT